MENLKVLVLNADHQPLSLVPLSVISWQDCFTIVTKGNAIPLKYHEGKYVNTPSTRLPVPSVIVLRDYKYFKKYAKWSKANVKLRDDYKCQYCNKRFSERSLTIDHVKPKSMGGKHSWFNSTTACKKCNQSKKNDHTIVPKHKPHKPTYYELAKKLFKHKSVENPEWGMYLKFLAN